MGIMNHMLNYNFFGIIFPDIDSAGETNSMESIQAQVDLCVKEHSVQPNVVLVGRQLSESHYGTCLLIILCSWTGSTLAMR